MIVKDAFVVTSKGNYGKVVSVGTTTAKVKIGYRVVEIELYNLTDVSEGTHFNVIYRDRHNPVKEQKTCVFLKHNTLVYSSSGKDEFIQKITHAVVNKTNIQEVLIEQVLIP